MRTDFQNFIDAVSSVIFAKEVGVADIDCDTLCKLARSHNMSNIIFAFLKQHPQTDPEWMAAHERWIDLLQYKHLMQKQEYAAVTALLQENRIRYMPLKGILLMGLYPDASMREMSDIDILVDRENLSRVKDLLTLRGYTFAHKGHHDVYTKEPGICFEVHETAVDRQRETGVDAYFEDAWRLATQDGFAYGLTPENEYIYLMTHFYGHFHQGGSGVRTVLDIYLYRKKYNLDFAYINAVFEKYGLQKFAENISDLAEVWFSEKEATPLLEELGEYILTSGTYGKIDRLHLDLCRTDTDKIGNIWSTVKRKLFLNKKEINIRYPWSKHILLMPIAYLNRMFDVVIHHRKEATDWVREFQALDNTKVKEHKKRMKRFGVRI